MIKYSPLISLGRIYSPLDLRELHNRNKIEDCRIAAENAGKQIAKELKETNPEINLDTVQIDPYQYITETEQMEYLVSARLIHQCNSKPKPKT